MNVKQFFAIKSDPKEIAKIIGLALAVIAAIGLYGTYRCANPQYRDPLMTKLQILDLDGWSISHFIAYFVATYLFPDYWWLIFILGVVWETIEQIFSKYRPSWLGGFGDCATTDPNIKNWWYGRLSDIVINALGILLALYVKRRTA